jgi:hypothetical protein
MHKGPRDSLSLKVLCIPFLLYVKKYVFHALTKQIQAWLCLGDARFAPSFGFDCLGKLVLRVELRSVVRVSCFEFRSCNEMGEM